MPAFFDALLSYCQKIAAGEYIGEVVTPSGLQVWDENEPSFSQQRSQKPS